MIYLDFLENHPEFLQQIMTKTHNEQVQLVEWNSLVNALNSVVGAPSLSKEIWQKRFQDWRYRVLEKHRAVVLDANATGGGLAKAKPLKDVEKRALALFNPITTTGDPSLLIEAGIDQVFVIPEGTFQVHVQDESDLLSGKVPFASYSTEREMLVDIELTDQRPTANDLQDENNTSIMNRNTTHASSKDSTVTPARLRSKRSLTNELSGGAKKKQRSGQLDFFMEKIEEIEAKKAEKQEAGIKMIAQSLDNFAGAIANLANAVVQSHNKN